MSRRLLVADNDRQTKVSRALTVPMVTEESGATDPAAVGEADAPPVAAAPYKVIFEANKCIGAGKCAAVSENWELDISTGVARPEVYFFDEDDLDHNVQAAEACPAKKDRGVIHVVDRRTGEEVAPDPEGDGTLSVDW
jgi:ferredoxin